jgi:hypothetical protein
MPLLVTKKGRRQILPTVRPPTQPGERDFVYNEENERKS